MYMIVVGVIMSIIIWLFDFDSWLKIVIMVNSEIILKNGFEKMKNNDKKSFFLKIWLATY